jgi:hypothetical protein
MPRLTSLSRALATAPKDRVSTLPIWYDVKPRQGTGAGDDVAERVGMGVSHVLEHVLRAKPACRLRPAASAGSRTHCGSPAEGGWRGAGRGPRPGPRGARSEARTAPPRNRARTGATSSANANGLGRSSLAPDQRGMVLGHPHRISPSCAGRHDICATSPVALMSPARA